MIFGTHEANTIEQFNDVASRAHKSALMADGHYGYVAPIGGVFAYRDIVSPIGVGVDIACGNCAIRTNMNSEEVFRNQEAVDELADEIFSTIKFGAGGVNTCSDAPKNHSLFEDDRWDLIHPKYRDDLKEIAWLQLGTTGGGNHYVDVFIDTDDIVWVGVHFGSRKFGFDLAHNFVALSQGLLWGEEPDMNSEVLLSLNTDLGHDYWHLMELAGKYAYAGREWVTRKVVSLFGGKEEEMIHNHHNFAWKEKHFGEELIVVRKGATPAFPGQKGFVGGSMGDQSVILQGADPMVWTGDMEKDLRPATISRLQKSSLYSTVHGAGRIMGRAEAKRGKWLGTKGGKSLRDESTIVTPEAMTEWIDQQGVTLRGGDVDEAPQVYRRLPDVLEAQGDTIEVLHSLWPIIVCMEPKRGRRS